MDGFATGSPAILRAYDASNLSTPLYASNQAGPRDTAGGGIKFSTPTIANGMVYLGTQTELDVYGLLPQAGGVSVASAPQVSGNGGLATNPAAPPSSSAMAPAGGGAADVQAAALDAVGSGGGANGPSALTDQEAMNEVAMNPAPNADLTMNPAAPLHSSAMAPAGGGAADVQAAALDALGSGDGANGPSALIDQEAMNEVVMNLARNSDLFSDATGGAKKKAS